MKAHRTLQSAGIAAIILYPLYRTNLADPAMIRMHSPASLTNYALAMIANLVSLTLFLTLVWTFLGKTRLGPWLRMGLPALLLASAAEAIYLYKRSTPSNGLWVAIFLVSLALTFLLKMKRLHAYQIAQQSGHAVLMGLGIFSLLVIIQLVRMALWRPAPNSTETAPVAITQASGHRPRVVWILMDELSYDQVFGHRAVGLALPNFDAFRQTSTLFTDVQPASEATQTAVPSIMLGRVIDRATYNSDNRYLVAFPGRPLQPFPAWETPFALAHQQGLSETSFPIVNSDFNQG